MSIGTKRDENSPRVEGSYPLPMAGAFDRIVGG